MFYIKQKVGNDLELTIDIHDENVFTRCPYCGVEFSVDLAEVLSEKDSDLFSTAVVCTACTKKLRG
ncbi:hypothetical protein H1220_04425 [Carnobacteriaceae bacterium zg-84]|uniref:hypothetical protein n=1 Tax=Granulicatella sp. zg-84 TaxID=2678503 RepID=UPI0013C11203|nr:hypothetical protein [Granulicatella sp. zg-84]NEW66066.1 hypothetical protein [Granulicatella sp. zg-84]QMI86596.1 hypothetical protein H1220_04425 [Carnobacteriaceae bacterium zg-84]